MDIGYVILLLLVLVYGATAALLYLRARREQPGPEAALGLPRRWTERFLRRNPKSIDESPAILPCSRAREARAPVRRLFAYPAAAYRACRTGWRAP